MSENKGIDDILQEIDEMIKEKEDFKNSTPTPLSIEDMHYIWGFTTACEIIRQMLMRIK